MKTISLQGIALGILISSMFSCETRDDSIAVNATKSTPTEEKKTFSCEDLLKTPEDFQGQVITLDAISWGANPSADGDEILMSIDDKKLEGLQQAHVLVHFSKDQEKEINHFKENDPISLTAKVSTYDQGALRLINATIDSN